MESQRHQHHKQSARGDPYAFNSKWVDLVEDDSDDQFDRMGSSLASAKYKQGSASIVLESTLLKNSTLTKASQDEDLDQLSKISINDMLEEVRSIWFALDGDEGQLHLDIVQVSKELCKSNIFPDLSSAQKYIQATIQSKASQLDFDDFNSIFCKGIFRHSIVSVAHRVEQNRLQSNGTDSSLAPKMNRQRINNMKEELKLGRIERPEELSQIVKRPILNELWSIFYRNVQP